MAGGFDYFLGQHHRADPHGAQCSCRDQVRYTVSSLLPSIVWHPGGKRPCHAQGLGCLRLVRYPDVDRRLGNLPDSRHFLPAWKELPIIEGVGINAAQLACFLLFWAINIAVIYRGIESIRFLLNIKAPLLILLGLALLAWAYTEAGGFGPILSQPSKFEMGGQKAGQFWSFFFPALTAMVGFWATLSLNIPDFTRYAYSQRDQVIGQAIGLPTTMGLYSFIGVAVTSATIIIYHEEIWDPVVLVTKFKNPVVLVVALFALCLATLATNLAANVVSPANDFAHLWPKKISFRTGGLITGVIGILILPWKLIADPSGYIFTWLIAYSALLGAVGGILIADYFVIRRRRLDLPGLYLKNGPYWYFSGFNLIALFALAVAIAPCLPGFLATVANVQVPTIWIEIYHYAWFVTFGLSLSTYLALMLASGRTPSKQNGERNG